MAEDIKEENNSEENSIQEESNDGLILDDENLESDETNDSTEDLEKEDTTNETEESLPIETEEDTEDSEIVENDENPIQQKQSKLQKILIIIISILSGILVLGFILYLFGVFDPEPPKPITTQMDTNLTKKPEKYVFNDKDINTDRLNGKLRLLTKYEIIGTAQEEAQKELEKNSKLSTKQINEMLQKEQERAEAEERKKEEEKAKAEALKIEEEKAKAEALKIEEEKAKAEALKSKESPYDLLKFIQVTTQESVIIPLKPKLDKMNVSISRCKDKGQNFILIGPFNSNKDLNTIFRSIYNDISKSATKKDLARIEYNRVCE